MRCRSSQSRGRSRFKSPVEDRKSPYLEVLGEQPTIGVRQGRPCSRGWNGRSGPNDVLRFQVVSLDTDKSRPGTKGKRTHIIETGDREARHAIQVDRSERDGSDPSGIVSAVAGAATHPAAHGAVIENRADSLGERARGRKGRGGPPTGGKSIF